MKQNTLVVVIVSGAICFSIGFIGGALLTMPHREKTKSAIEAAEVKARQVQTIAQEEIQAAKAEAEHFQNELKSVTEKLQEAKTEIARLRSEQERHADELERDKKETKLSPSSPSTEPKTADGKQISVEQKRVQEQEYQQKQAKLKADLDGFMAALKAAGIDKSIIDRCSAEDDKLTIVVANAWHFQPYQIRLQAAQNLWNLWAKLRSPNDLDKARIELTDYNGNSAGGSRWLAGALIWVKKE